MSDDRPSEEMQETMKCNFELQRKLNIELKEALQREDMFKSTFFRCMVKALINDRDCIRKLLNEYKAKHEDEYETQDKRDRWFIRNEREKKEEVEKKLTGEDVEQIYDVISDE